MDSELKLFGYALISKGPVGACVTVIEFRPRRAARLTLPIGYRDRKRHIDNVGYTTRLVSCEPHIIGHHVCNV